MRFGSFALRFACLVALAVWLGGFTFYGACVVPVLHDLFSSLDAGFVTQRVTDDLNLIGLGTVVLWWLAAIIERRAVPIRARQARLALLALTSAVLAALVVLHRLMDAQLETGSLRGFYPLHRVYLILSTIQWLANLGLLGTAICFWDKGGGCSGQSQVRQREG